MNISLDVPAGGQGLRIIARLPAAAGGPNAAANRLNPGLDKLHPYPFEKLTALLDGVTPPEGVEPIALSMGEPQHPSPPRVLEVLRESLGELGRYPATRGLPELREAIAGWLERRFALPAGNADPERHVLPVNGTREALFAFAQCVLDPGRGARPLVLLPNPFYQIYEGAALLAGLEPYYYDGDAHTIDEQVLARAQLLYLCTPANPTGRVLEASSLQRLLELARRHDFVIASDECYSEIYFDESRPPGGLLGAAAAGGDPDFARCLVFHSLSKRSNLPGLRSGFVAGDARLIERFHAYRTYHGCAMSIPVQRASIAAWLDEEHVAANRRLYRDKFAQALGALDGVLDARRPEAGFYLWPRTPGDDREFARRLYAATGVKVLPGQFLSREANGRDPGRERVRMALVAEPARCAEAMRRIADFLR